MTTNPRPALAMSGAPTTEAGRRLLALLRVADEVTLPNALRSKPGRTSPPSITSVTST